MACACSPASNMHGIVGLEMVAYPMVMTEVRENLEEPYFRALLDQREAEQA
jgi:hypothetical protein